MGLDGGVSWKCIAVASLSNRFLRCSACSFVPLQVEYMKSLGYMDKKHNRRRDEFVNYVEAHAKMHALTAKGPAAGH
eukprot:1150836-Pelagomonas_calceolata.AAC.1